MTGSEPQRRRGAEQLEGGGGKGENSPVYHFVDQVHFVADLLAGF